MNKSTQASNPDKGGKSKAGKNSNDNRESNGNRDGGAGARSRDLRDSPMMAHLQDELEKGTDIGHYGRLTFTMIARHFLEEDKLVSLLSKQPEQDEESARALLLQVEGRDYNPPRRERILEWQEQQDFPICPTPDDPNSCNVYSELAFPEEIYESINEFYEEKTAS